MIPPFRKREEDDMASILATIFGLIKNVNPSIVDEKYAPEGYEWQYRYVWEDEQIPIDIYYNNTLNRYFITDRINYRIQQPIVVIYFNESHETSINETIGNSIEKIRDYISSNRVEFKSSNSSTGWNRIYEKAFMLFARYIGLPIPEDSSWYNWYVDNTFKCGSTQRTVMWRNDNSNETIWSSYISYFAQGFDMITITSSNIGRWYNYFDDIFTNYDTIAKNFDTNARETLNNIYILYSSYEPEPEMK